MAVASGDQGFIIQGEDGLPIFFPFGTEEAHPCDPDPEMLVTVTGTTGTINWLGQTWELPADSGVQKGVCPTTYINVSADPDRPPFSTFGTEKWTWKPSANAIASLRMTGTYFVANYSSFYEYGAAERVAVPQLTTINDFRNHNHTVTSGGFTTYSICTASNPLGVLPGGCPPQTIGNARISDAAFGSTTIGGITYAWERGAGWP